MQLLKNSFIANTISDYLKSSRLEVLFLLLIYITNIIWFYPISGKTLMGDDLVNWFSIIQKNNFFDAILLNVDSEKYRPIYNILQYVTFNLFGANFPLFIIFNIFLNCIIIYLFYKIIKSITKSDYISFGTSILLVTSRFAYYNLLQIIGSLEALSLIWLLLIVFFCIKFLQTNNIRLIYIVFFLNGLLVFTHERFIVLLPAYILILIFSKYLTIKQRVLFSFMFALPLALNFILKVFVFKITFLEGTSGADISPNIYSITKFFKDGIFNIFGFNRGPVYVSGVFFNDLCTITRALTFIVFFILVYFITRHILILIKNKKTFSSSSSKLFFLFIITEFILLISASITIRQEFRWLYAPYIIFLIYASYVLATIKINKPLKYSLFIILIFASIAINIDYRGHLDHYYFTSSQKWSDSFYEQTIKNGVTPDKYQIAVISFPSDSWVLRPNLYFEQFYRGKGYKIKFVEAVLFNSGDNLKVYRLSIPKGSFSEVR